MSLRDGNAKMSKSDPSDMSRINLTDSDDVIAQKIRKAKTDPEPLPGRSRGARRRGRRRRTSSASTRAVTDESVEQVLARFAGQGFGAFKPALADALVALIAPIRARLDELRRDPARAGPHPCRGRRARQRHRRAGSRQGQSRCRPDAVRAILGQSPTFTAVRTAAARCRNGSRRSSPSRGPDRLTFSELAAQLHSRAWGGLLFIFGAINTLPLPPGTSIFFAIPLLIVSAQMAFGRPSPWFPSRIDRRGVTKSRARAADPQDGVARSARRAHFQAAPPTPYRTDRDPTDQLRLLRPFDRRRNSDSRFHVAPAGTIVLFRRSP